MAYNRHAHPRKKKKKSGESHGALLHSSEGEAGGKQSQHDNLKKIAFKENKTILYPSMKKKRQKQ